VRIDGQWKAAEAILDIGSDYNLINKSFLAESAKLEKFSNFPSLTAIGNLPIPTYGMCPLYAKARNALGYEHTYLLRFVVADIDPFTVLLS
jgi:hypothetical protein